MLDAVAGQVPIFFTVLGNAAQFAKTGKVRLLAVASLQRLATYPELPTIAESGFPGYDAFPWFGMLGAAGMPREAIARLAPELIAAVSVPEVNERIRGFSLEPTAIAPEPFAQLMKSDYERWSRVVREAHIQVD
jgi:tripartite-type tricarboxylate transporter receptor subunit TctC